MIPGLGALETLQASGGHASSGTGDLGGVYADQGNLEFGLDGKELALISLAIVAAAVLLPRLVK